MENSDIVPWADLRYIFGEIMYGGHITDDWDRLLCRSYLEFYMTEAMFDGVELYPYINIETAGNVLLSFCSLVCFNNLNL